MKTDITQVPGCKNTTAQMIMKSPGLNVMHISVAPQGEIPVHQHDCAATMYVTRGSAWTCGTEVRKVSKGDVIIKKPNEPHGFNRIEEDFEFVSVSDHDGILGEHGWDMTYLP